MYLAKCHLLWEAEKTGIAGPEIQESDTRWGRGVFTKKQVSILDSILGAK